MIRSLFILSIIFCWSCKTNVEDPKSNTEVKTVVAEEDSLDLEPIMLDDIHYYTLDRATCNTFFEENFGTRPMVEESPNPFKFIDFQLVKSGQSTINISKQGPFPGINEGAPGRWERDLMTPAANNPARYGVHWLAFSTSDLEKCVSDFRSNGVEIIDEDFKLPNSDEKAMLCFGPDYNLIVVKQSSDNVPGFSIDHLLLLVKDLNENVAYFRDVFRGEILDRNDSMATMKVGNHILVMALPSAIGLDAKDVLDRDSKVFRPDIDHLGFFYKNVRKAYAHASELGYKFLSPPVPIKYYDKPTLYTFVISQSPDGLQCEMYQEDGRLGSRTKFK